MTILLWTTERLFLQKNKFALHADRKQAEAMVPELIQRMVIKPNQIKVIRESDIKIRTDLKIV